MTPAHSVTQVWFVHATAHCMNLLDNNMVMVHVFVHVHFICYILCLDYYVCKLHFGPYCKCIVYEWNLTVYIICNPTYDTCVYELVLRFTRKEKNFQDLRT